MVSTMTTKIGTAAPTTIGQSAIESATRHNKWIFLLYMAFVIGGAVLTYLLWRSGNTVQNAIVADADARIEEAKTTAAQANERSKNLERENLVLTSSLATQKGAVAGLQIEASNAKAAQQQVEIELAKQQERAAKAELALAQLQGRLAVRVIGPKVHQEAVRELRAFAGAKVGLLKIGPNDKEVDGLVDQISAIFSEAHWSVARLERVLVGGPEDAGIVCSVNPHTAAGRKAATVCLIFPAARVRPSERNDGGDVMIEVRPRQTP